MLKSLLIAIAALVSFDAAAWESEVRTKLVRDVRIALADLSTLDWTWG